MREKIERGKIRRWQNAKEKEKTEEPIKDFKKINE
jgi:hypothetical protein